MSVLVGVATNARKFDIDLRLLSTQSQFFATMLSGPWRESQTKAVSLTDDDPDVFDVFARFIYTGDIFSSRDGDTEVYPDGSRRDWEWARLARAWVLGDKLQATTFKDAVADAICEKIVRGGKWPTTLHQIIYPNTTASARGIRRLCVDIAVAKWEVNTMKSTLKDEAWCEFFEDVSIRLHMAQKREKAAGIDFERPGCRYHAHVAEGVSCWREATAYGAGLFMPKVNTEDQAS